MDAPFVLLDDARAGHGRLYRRPAEILRADRPDEVGPLLAALRMERRHAAGFLSYEAGLALDPHAPADALIAEGPLAWFGLFDGVETVDPADWLPDPAGGWAGQPAPAIDEAGYARRFARVREAIMAGDIYQANLAFHAEVPVEGSPAALYAALRRRQRMRHGALVFTGERWLLSLSPELFLSVAGDMVRARPMKGTAAAGADPATLSADPKQRAENLMIVDLIRNDLSRVAVLGSVRVPRLFAVEHYPTLSQMVSDVEATLAPGRGPADLLEAAFPCGSITGAPKLKAMAILREVEDGPRGAYTGAIGAIAPGGDCDFNVAIRTLELPVGATVARMGLGSGVVADSNPADEWRECLTKGAFVAAPATFDLIETMRLDVFEGILFLERHLERMWRSAARFGFDFDRHDIRNELQAAIFRAREDAVVRLLLGRDGGVAIELRPLPPAPDGPADVALAPLPVPPDDLRLRHKTSDRAFYDRTRQANGRFETIFHDAEGRLTEGSFTNLFVPQGKTLLTPPLARGLLPGILRQSLIEDGRAVEADVTLADLSDGFFVGNAVRGLLPARLAPL